MGRVYHALEANAKVKARGPFSHPNPPKPLNQFRCHVKYIRHKSPQGVDVQNLVGDTDSAGRILKVEGHSGGSNYFGAKRRKKFSWCPPLCSCAHPVFDGIRDTTIKVKQF